MDQSTFSDQSPLSTSTYADLVELGRRLYERSLVRQEDEEITDPRGQPIGWLLDTRVPMLDGEMFAEVGAVLAERMRAKGQRQVAGYGFGAFSIVCAVLSAEGAGDGGGSGGDGASSRSSNPSSSNPSSGGSGNAPAFKGGFIREERKPHGRHRLVEGPLRRDEPVVLVDDILNSGRSATRAIALLEREGFEVAGLMTLFSFTWSSGRTRLEADGLWVDSLLDLNLRDGGRSSSDSL